MNIPKINLVGKKTSNSEINLVNNVSVNLSKENTAGVADREIPTYNPYLGVGEIGEICVQSSELNSVMRENHELKIKNEVLEIILLMNKENPLYINKLLVVDDVRLVKLIELMTGGKVSMDLEVLFNSCCSAEEYKTINCIYVNINGEEKNLKYEFPAVVKYLKEQGISLKFCW